MATDYRRKTSEILMIKYETLKNKKNKDIQLEIEQQICRCEENGKYLETIFTSNED